MSFNLDQIIKNNHWIYNKNIDEKDTRQMLYNILGECISQDILSNTCECKRTWTIYERYSLIKGICEKLSIPWRIETEDGIWEPYAPEGWL